MAYGDPYASVLELETRLGKSDDGTFLDILKAASRAVERFTRRQFNKDTSGTPTATARHFRALDPERLPVDDFHTTTALVISVNSVTWALTTVELRPLDGVVDGQIGWPFSDILTKGRSWPSGRRAKVLVTAHWGWAAVPEAIQQATLDVAELMTYGGGSTSSGVVRSQSIDGYAVTYAAPTMTSAANIPPELVKAEPYQRKRLGLA